MKKERQISYMEKSYNELKVQNNKQSIEGILIERAVKTTIQVLYDKGFFNILIIDTKCSKNTHIFKRRRSDLEEINDVSH